MVLMAVLISANPTFSSGNQAEMWTRGLLWCPEPMAKQSRWFAAGGNISPVASANIMSPLAPGSSQHRPPDATCSYMLSYSCFQLWATGA